MSDQKQKTLSDVAFDFSMLDLDEQLALLTISNNASPEEMQTIFKVARRISNGTLVGVQAPLEKLIEHFYNAYGAYANPKAETPPSETA